MAAAARVFAIGELVEMILLELPMKDLLLSQRINRACKTAVDSSSRIQKALFFIPGLPEDTNVPDIDPDLLRSSNPDHECECSSCSGCSLDDEISEEESIEERNSDEDDENSDRYIKPPYKGRSDFGRSFGKVITGNLSAELAKCWRLGNALAAAKDSGIAFNPLLVLTLKVRHVREFRAEIYAQTFDLPEDASCFKMLTTQPPVNFPVTNIIWRGRETADADVWKSRMRTCSLPRSIEGSTIRKLAKALSNIREKVEEKQKKKTNHGFYELRLYDCTLEDPKSLFDRYPGPEVDD